MSKRDASYFLFIMGFARNMYMVVSRKLFTACTDASFITLNREVNRPYYRASVARAIQSSALYSKYRFHIYDTPWWPFTYGMIGFLRRVYYSGFILQIDHFGRVICNLYRPHNSNIFGMWLYFKLQYVILDTK